MEYKDLTQELIEENHELREVLHALSKVLYFKEKDNCYELHTTRSRLFKTNNAQTKDQKKDQKRLVLIKSWLDEVKSGIY